VKLKIYQIDAFTDKLFGGNPAAVCPLENWPTDEILQNIAIENNLAETAFFVQLSKNHFHLRWFTPEHEMDLCGHATLASAFVIFNEIGNDSDDILFDTQSGLLKVKKVAGYLELDFPSRPPIKSNLPKIIGDGLNIQPKEIWKARDYLLVYDSLIKLIWTLEESLLLQKGMLKMWILFPDFLHLKQQCLKIQ